MSSSMKGMGMREVRVVDVGLEGSELDTSEQWSESEETRPSALGEDYALETPPTRIILVNIFAVATRNRIEIERTIFTSSLHYSVPNLPGCKVHSAAKCQLIPWTPSQHFLVHHHHKSRITAHSPLLSNPAIVVKKSE